VRFVTTSWTTTKIAFLVLVNTVSNGRFQLAAHIYLWTVYPSWPRRQRCKVLLP
jgi:hypothetical protein